MAGGTSRDASRFDNAPAASGTATPGVPKGDKAAGKPVTGGVLESLKKGEGFAPVPSVPQSQ